MSLLSDLRPRGGSTKKKFRVGRGHASGAGKTAGRGHKGQKARKSPSIPRGFEGGQMPIMRRLPKFGFTNAAFKKTFDIINIKDLERFDGEVTPETLKAAGLVGNNPVKILGDGELKKGLTVKANKFSASAAKASEAAGGKAEVL